MRVGTFAAVVFAAGVTLGPAYAELEAVDLDMKSIYYGSGAHSDSIDKDGAVAVTCTNFEASVAKYGANLSDIKLEVYTNAGNLDCALELNFSGPGVTLTFATDDLARFVGEEVLPACTPQFLPPGSLRILASKKNNAKIICSAYVMDQSTGDALAYPIPLTRTKDPLIPKDVKP